MRTSMKGMISAAMLQTKDTNNIHGMGPRSQACRGDVGGGLRTQGHGGWPGSWARQSEVLTLHPQ